MPRYVYRGGRGVRATYQRRLARPTVGVVPALLLFYRMTAGLGERKSHISTPLDMFRFRPFFPICITHSSAKGFLWQRRYMAARTFRLPLTLFNTFNIFPRTGQCAFPWAVQVMGNSGQSAFPVRFFLLHRIGWPRLSALRRNARLSSKRTGTSPTVTRRRIPPRNIRNHSLYLSGTALCGAIDAYERSAAEGLVKLARLCVAPRRDRSAVPDFTSHCNFSAENRVNNKDKGRIRPAAVLYIGRGRSAGPPLLISKIINERRRHNRAAEGARRTYPSL